MRTSSSERSPRKCRRISSRFRPSIMKFRSASVTGLPCNSKNLLQVFLWIGWLSTITPSMSNITACSIRRSSPYSNFEPRPIGLGDLIIFESSDVKEVVGNAKRCHLSDEIRQDMKADIGRNAIRNEVKKG